MIEQFTPDRVIALMMIGSAVGGFLGQAAIGAATLLRVRAVIDARVGPVERQIEEQRIATSGRLDMHEKQIGICMRCEQCHEYGSSRPT
jgi:hypothetical protein